MAPNIFGLRRVLRMDAFSSFGSSRDVKPSVACFLKLCSCAMFVCGYAVLARDQTHFLHSTSCCFFVEWSDFAWLRHVFQLRHVFADAPCFFRCAIIFCVFGLRQKFWEQDSLGIQIYVNMYRERGRDSNCASRWQFSRILKFSGWRKPLVAGLLTLNRLLMGMYAISIITGQSQLRAGTQFLRYLRL